MYKIIQIQNNQIQCSNKASFQLQCTMLQLLLAYQIIQNQGQLGIKQSRIVNASKNQRASEILQLHFIRIICFYQNRNLIAKVPFNELVTNESSKGNKYEQIHRLNRLESLSDTRQSPIFHSRLLFARVWLQNFKRKLIMQSYIT